MTFLGSESVPACYRFEEIWFFFLFWVFCVCVWRIQGFLLMGIWERGKWWLKSAYMSIFFKCQYFTFDWQRRIGSCSWNQCCLLPPYNGDIILDYLNGSHIITWNLLKRKRKSEGDRQWDRLEWCDVERTSYCWLSGIQKESTSKRI